MFGSYLNTCDVELFIGWNEFAVQLVKRICCEQVFGDLKNRRGV